MKSTNVFNVNPGSQDSPIIFYFIKNAYKATTLINSINRLVIAK
jgi:hypothetical protein